ncbi:hypothetical protein KBA73_04130 [Patescibacteria group bacterium]|nr:hypothetical protein [Patescibacteria group bacterium]
MSITLFLAQIWGPILFSVGLGVFVSRPYYLKAYRNLEKETLAVLMYGMVLMAAGIVQVSVHNTWNSLPQIIISLLGWAMLLKGIAFAIVPKLVDRGGDWTADSNLLPLVGGGAILLGAYLSWISYFL